MLIISQINFLLDKNAESVFLSSIFLFKERRCNMSNLFIPDISHHDPVISWSAVKKYCSFLITKATEGTTYVDPTLKDFIRQCEKNKIHYWLYTFLKNGDELAQTKFMVNTCKNLVGDYFVGYVLDVERNNGPKSVETALNWLKKQSTAKTMLYTQYSQYDRYKKIIDNRGTTAWWEARYGKNTRTYNSAYPPHAGVDLHQFTENGSVPGIRSAVDLNRVSGKKKDLQWFTRTILEEKAIEADPAGSSNSLIQPSKKEYSGIYPTLPIRGYFARKDGITALLNYPTQIKRIQELINWIDDKTSDVVVDGKFGVKTEQKVKAAQKILSVPQTGKFDKATLSAAKQYRK